MLGMVHITRRSFLLDARTGCTLCSKYGTYKAHIMDQLRKLKAKQKEKNGLPKQLSYFLSLFKESILSRSEKTSEEVKALVGAEIAN